MSLNLRQTEAKGPDLRKKPPRRENGAGALRRVAALRMDGIQQYLPIPPLALAGSRPHWKKSGPIVFVCNNLPIEAPDRALARRIAVRGPSPQGPASLLCGAANPLMRRPAKRPADSADSSRIS
ncbi:hypothetical protein [Stappia stellulata]|uniref:hypothetical protein n=1 Tax=Stappia stellulata TaxID=71235 RepID=UPI0012EB0E7A|nr:hypothetical protein [Stappia stellulata]